MRYSRERATTPEDLDRLFLQRANAVDVEGVVALYEPAAVLATSPGNTAIGADALRRFYLEFLASRPTVVGEVRPAVRNGDLAITATTRTGNATVELARQQPGGHWLWVIDQPAVFG